MRSVRCGADESAERLRGRRGAALLDALMAVMLASVGLLAAVSVMQHGLQTAARARWVYLSVSATRDIADSLGLAGAGGPGSRSLPPVTVRWSPAGGRLYRFEAFAPDSAATPRIVVHAHVPAPVP